MTSDPGKTRQSAPSRRPLSRRRKEGEENFLRPRANVPRLFLPSSLLSSILSFFSTRTFYLHVCLFLLQDFSHKFYFPLYIYIYICSFILTYFIEFFSISSTKIPRSSSLWILPFSLRRIAKIWIANLLYRSTYDKRRVTLGFYTIDCITHLTKGRSTGRIAGRCIRSGGGGRDAGTAAAAVTRSQNLYRRSMTPTLARRS